VARQADGWIPSLGYVGLDDLRRASQAIDAEARAARRDPDDITKLLNVGGMIGDVDPSDVPLAGPVQHWVETLSRWSTEIGTDSFVIYPADGDPDQVRRLAAEVAPAVRERLGR
jgi:alkanesulfonate monooxygenase SsuD/methylene tetrahydromethanopterin reductase-like flavin-dependent oxidoreductase (luciferase family)